MTSIMINKAKKSNLFRLVLDNLIFFGSFTGSFYLNFKLIGGNVFLDILLFILGIIIIIAFHQKCKMKFYHNVNDDKINQVEKILNS